MDADTFNLMGIIALFVVIIVVSVLIIQSQGTTLTSKLPSQLQNTFKEFVDTVMQKSPYNICEAYSGKEISVQDFQTILQAVSRGQCGDVHANISLTFSLTKEDIVKISKLAGIASDGNLIFYNLTRPVGVGSLIIQGTPGEYPLKTFDFVDMWQQGSPVPDTFIVKTIKGCDPTDEVCDLSCIYKKICDPACDDNRLHNIPCNVWCIDSNGNGIVDIEDAQKRIDAGKCNLDCYSNRTNPFKAYDPGCIWKFKDQIDGICDPNSVGVKDGVCDPDCVDDKNICDPDCDGKVSTGNPLGKYDEKCFVCDKRCNSWCSPVCTAIDNDPDCPSGFDGGTKECCGNGICNVTAKENCDTCSKDCPGGGTTCADLNGICCLQDPDADFSGCTINKEKKEGDTCFCKNQCATDLACDSTKHCCPTGKSWNGTHCFVPNTYNLVFVPIGYSNFEEFKSDAEKSFNEFLARIPLKECSDERNRISAIIIDPSRSSSCQISRCSFICDDCNNRAEACVNSLPDVKSIFNRIVALCKGNTCPGACGCANGIPAASSSTNMVNCRGVLYEIPSHETGHAMGLCHVDCGGAAGACLGWCPNKADCNEPDKVQFIMDYCFPMSRYGPAAYSFLKNVEFKKYMC